MKNRKGFTLVELLFVMAIMAILAGFAIANLKDSQKKEIENSLKKDAMKANELQEKYFLANSKYDSLYGDFDSSENGVLTSKNGTRFTISEGNSLETEQVECADGTIGFFINIKNENPANNLYYSSCGNGTAQISTEGE